MHGDPSIVLRGREGSRKYTLNWKYFDDIQTIEQAYWLGFITADGGVIRNSKTYALRLELAEVDRAHVGLFAEALGSNKPLQEYRSCVSISLDSWRLVESLEKLGITQRKSATVQPWIGPAHLMSHYWRGLFDGDGSICRSGRYWQMKICGSIYCVREFADWAKDVCGSKAEPLPSSRGSSCWQWTVCSNRMSRLLAEALYLPGAIALERKQVLADAICDRG